MYYINRVRFITQPLYEILLLLPYSSIPLHPLQIRDDSRGETRSFANIKRCAKTSRAICITRKLSRFQY